MLRVCVVARVAFGGKTCSASSSSNSSSTSASASSSSLASCGYSGQEPVRMKCSAASLVGFSKNCALVPLSCVRPLAIKTTVSATSRTWRKWCKTVKTGRVRAICRIKAIKAVASSSATPVVGSSNISKAGLLKTSRKIATARWRDKGSSMTGKFSASINQC